MFDRVHNSLHDSNPLLVLIDIDYNKRKCKGEKNLDCNKILGK